jgi:hypothetical protein
MMHNMIENDDAKHKPLVTDFVQGDDGVGT